MVNILTVGVTTNENTLPAGTFSYSNSDEEPNAWCYVDVYDFNPAQDAAADSDEELSNATYFYVSDWNPGYESGNMTVTRNGNSYRIEINDMRLLKDADGDDGVSSDEPKTTATFVWKGELEDITDWVNEGEYSRSFSQRMSFAKSMHVVK